MSSLGVSGTSSARAAVHRERLVQAVLALYDNTLARETSPCDTTAPAPVGALASPADAEELWDPNVTFRDPLMKVVGIQHYRAQFAALHGVFPTIRLQVYSVSWGNGAGKLSQGAVDMEPPASKCPAASAPDVFVIDAFAVYEMNRFIKVGVRQVSTIRLGEDPTGQGLGRIVAHEDVWSFADLIESIPLLGALYRWVQPKLGALVSRKILAHYAAKAGVRTAGGPGKLSTNTLHAAYHPLEAQRIGAKPLLSAGERGEGENKSGQEDGKGDEKDL